MRSHVQASSGACRHSPPCIELALVGDGCIRRAGGRQAQIFDGLGHGGGMHMPAVALFGFGAVEENMGDFRMFSEERRKIVRDERLAIDTGVQAAFAPA